MFCCDKISSRDIRTCPSRRSAYRSSIWQFTCKRNLGYMRRHPEITVMQLAVVFNRWLASSSTFHRIQSQVRLIFRTKHLGDVFRSPVLSFAYITFKITDPLLPFSSNPVPSAFTVWNSSSLGFHYDCCNE